MQEYCRNYPLPCFTRLSHENDGKDLDFPVLPLHAHGIYTQVGRSSNNVAKGLNMAPGMTSVPKLSQYSLRHSLRNSCQALHNVPKPNLEESILHSNNRSRLSIMLEGASKGSTCSLNNRNYMPCPRVTSLPYPCMSTTIFITKGVHRRLGVGVHRIP